MRLCSEAIGFVNESHLPFLKGFEDFTQEKVREEGEIGLYNDNLFVKFIAFYC